VQQELAFAHRSRPAGPLIAKLSLHVSLTTEDVSALHDLCRHRRTLKSNATLVHESTRLSAVFLILKGVAFRYKLLANGKRQIFGYLMPGDICDADFLISDRCDHTVCALTDAEVAVIPIRELNSCIARSQRIGRALTLAGQSDAADLRGWLLNMGQRPALQRIAHFLCDMSAKLYTGTRPAGGLLPMPLTQHELADTVGLTVVHVNRCLQRLRDAKVIAWGRRCVTILDRDRLLHIAASELFVKVEQPAPTALHGQTFARGA
jgi:CRP-like cAMP-binding protein